jgi:hypothetical protein
MSTAAKLTSREKRQRRKHVSTGLDGFEWKDMDVSTARKESFDHGGFMGLQVLSGALRFAPFCRC